MNETGQKPADCTWLITPLFGIILLAAFVSLIVRAPRAVRPNQTKGTIVTVSALPEKEQTRPSGVDHPEWQDLAKHGYGTLVDTKRDGRLVFAYGRDKSDRLTLPEDVSACWLKYREQLGPCMNVQPTVPYYENPKLPGKGLLYVFRGGIIVAPRQKDWEVYYLPASTYIELTHIIAMS